MSTLIIAPIPLLDPNNKSNKYSITTGGKAKGNDTNISSRNLPLKFFLLNIHHSIIVKSCLYYTLNDIINELNGLTYI